MLTGRPTWRTTLEPDQEPNDARHDEQSRSDTIKANSKIVKERIWTLNSPFRQQTARSCLVTSKIIVQPLDTDTDAHFARRECDFSAKRSRICISSCTRENVPRGVRTPWKLFDVMKFQEEIKVAQKTAVTPQVQRQAQMAQTMTRSKVQNISKPDLEQTAAQSPDAMMQPSSRQPRSCQVRRCRSRADNRRA